MTENILGDKPENEPKNYLEALVGPGGKFYRENREEALEALAKGKWEADQVIPLQNRRMDELREAYLRVDEENKTKDQLETLIAQYQGLASTKQPSGKEETQPAVKIDDLRNIAAEEFTKLKRQDYEQNNLSSVQAKLKEQLGENYATVVRERIREIGLTEQDFHDWAKRSPKAVLNAIGIDEKPRQQETFQSPPSTQRTFKPVTEQKRTWTYYQELKKANPKIYYDKAIMNQMLEDREKLGAEFEDGDYHTRNF